ncbi:MAG: hypothetical protein Greene041619_282 [Candidatus Peregrinibacteria bacterium Greene0416_19]|nr:MAG: hypothetical protein Greene041619_282 [Candidatus Peregrinibacteria bacterium Greene0416_19]
MNLSALKNEIHVFPGTDPNFLKQPIDPSGFTSCGFSQTETEGILEFVRDQYVENLGKAPALLQETAAKEIPVYCGKPENVEALVSFEPEEHVFKDDHFCNYTTGSSLPFKGTKLPTVRGLQFNPLKNKSLDEYKDTIGHEALHVISKDTVSPCQHAIAEAWVARMGKHYFGPEKHGVIAEKLWDNDRFQSTVGFGLPDFAACEHSVISHSSLYLYSYNALDSVHTDQLWKIWELLTEKAHSSKFLPRVADVHTVIRQVAQEDGEKALQDPTFLPMKPGIHHCAFPTRRQDGSMGEDARIYTFAVAPRNDFGSFTPRGTFMNTMYQCGDTNPVPMKIGLQDKNNMIWALGDGVLAPATDFNYSSIIQSLETRPETANAMKQCMGTRISIHMKVLNPVLIEDK